MMQAFTGPLRLAAIGLATFALWLAGGIRPSVSADIRVFTSGAPAEVQKNLAARFSETTGHRILVAVATLAAITERSAAESPDIVVLPTPAIESLDKMGMLRAGSRSVLARVGIGVAVREGARRPDISTPEAVRRTLLEARSIVHSDPRGGGITGAHISRMMAGMGIAEAVKSKVTLLFAIGGGTDAVAKGDAEIGLFNISEILPVKGVTLVGPLPPELQNYITFSGALHAGGKSPDAAKAFLRFLSEPAAREAWAAGGFESLGSGH